MSATGLRNLTVTPAVRAELLQAFLANRGYQPGWIAGTEPGSVFYAYDAATASYLAWAGFVPTKAAPERVLVGLQDDGARTAFRHRADAAWQVYDVCTTPAFFELTGGNLGGGGGCGH